MPRSTLTGSNAADNPVNPEPPGISFNTGVVAAIALTILLWLAAVIGVVVDAAAFNLPNTLIDLALAVALAATLITVQLRAHYAQQTLAYERTRAVLARHAALKEDTGEIPKIGRVLAQRTEPDIIVVPVPERHFEQVPDRERAREVLHAAEAMVRQMPPGGGDGAAVTMDEKTWRAYLAGFYDRQNGQGDAGGEPLGQ
jgi:hypothetical protein